VVSEVYEQYTNCLNFGLHVMLLVVQSHENMCVVVMFHVNSWEANGVVSNQSSLA
jgi:hypothetical protein